MFFARSLKSTGRVACQNGKPETAPRAPPPARSGRGHRPGPALRLPHARPAHGGGWPLLARGATAPVAPLRAGGGNAARVSFSRPEGRSPGCPVSLAGAIAPATALRCPLTSRGPQPPASARPAPGGRFAPAGSGAGLCWSRTCRSTGDRSARAGETRVAFPVPARRGVLRDARSLRQGPSPLPRRCAGIRTGRGPKPPASARPARGGRFAPAGSGAGLSWCLDRPVSRAPSRAGGGNALRFLVPPGEAKALSPLQWQGPSPLPQRCAGIRTGRGPKPPASADPPPAGASRPPGRALAYRGA